jgi:thiamine biosynthesis lipoprotein
VRLNRQGFLEMPPIELVDLLARARAVSAMSGGAFDVTVQPLWDAYAAHFAQPGADPAGPPQPVLDAALSRVDWRAVDVAPERIAFAKPGMAITLNGIAQGYITDRGADRFHAEGFANILVDLGEARALGRHPAGRPWQIRPGEGRDEILLTDGALATSAPDGTTFSAALAANQIFDPRSGRGATLHQWVSVAAPTATEADAWSTAFALMPTAAIRATIPRTAIRKVWLPDAVMT